MGVKPKMSLCLVAGTGQEDKTKWAGRALFSDIIPVEELTRDGLQAAISLARCPWVMLLFASENIDPVTLSDFGKELGKNKTWGFAFPVTYQNEANGTAGEEHWEVRLVKKGHGCFQGIGLSMGCPGQLGIRFAEGMEIENPDQQKLSEGDEPDYLRPFVQAQATILSGEPAETVIATCSEVMSLVDLPYYQASAYCLAGKTLFALKELGRAAAVLQEGLEKYPDCAEMWLQQGELYLAQGNPQYALNCLARALTIGSSHYPGRKGANSFLALQGLGRAYERLLDLSKAIEHYRQAYGPGFNEPLYNIGRLFVQHLGVQAAREQLEQLMLANGDIDPEVLADVFYANGSYEQALAYLEKAEPSANIAFFRGMVLARLGRWAEAVRAFMKVERNHPLYTKSSLQICFCYWVRNKFKQGGEILSKIAVNEDPEVQQYLLVSSLLRKQTVKQLPGDWEVCLGIFNRFLEVEHHANAATLAAYLEDVPRQEVQLTLAKIYTLHRDYAKTIKCLDSFKMLGEMSGEAYHYLARAYMDSGQLAAAFRCLNEQVLAGEANIETYLLAVQILVRQAVQVLETGSRQLKAPELEDKAGRLREVMNLRG